jgi:hypothetical protein
MTTSSRDDERRRYGAALLNRHFVGEAFQDALFNTDNNEREKACCWKIQSTSALFGSFTNNSPWSWRAVGLPLQVADPTLQGDIDFMFALLSPKREVSYRCFEVKTAKVKRSGEVKSLKGSKFYKTVAQLEKLCSFGAPVTVLLEAFIVETGYTGSRFVMPAAVRESISAKYDQITRADFGYAALAIEQIRGFSEDATGLLWPAETIKGAKVRPSGTKFLDLVSQVEAYLQKARTTDYNGYRSVVTYCYRCKSLTWADCRGPYVCRECGAALL